MWRDANGYRILDHAYTGSITSLSTQALPNIHFPSVERLEFRLPRSTTRVFANTDDELRDSFIYLAVGLESATNLEELHVDIALMIKYDGFNSRMIYEVFAKNLAKCKKLKRLKIFNSYIIQRESYFSLGFLLALIPAIEQGVSTIEEVTLLIGNRPVAVPTPKVQLNAALDLFVAILRLQKLKQFNLQLNLYTSSLLNIFLQAAQHVRQTAGTLPSELVESFMLTCVLYKVTEGVPNRLPSPLSLAPCLALLGNSLNLKAFVVKVPPACWDSKGVVDLKNVLSSKPHLRQLGLYFSGYECASGKCLEYILDYIQERENCPDNSIHVSGLECHNAKFDEEEALDRYYSREGQKCLSWDDKGLKFQATGYMIGW